MAVITKNEMIWINEYVDYNLHEWIATCSNCYTTTSCSFTKVSLDFDYCPHCGAKAIKANSN